MVEKTALFLLPGLLCDETIWSYQHKALDAFAEIRVPRFLGLSSITAMAERVLEEAPLRFAVAAHSMGARVALEIHRLAHARIERLMLLDTGVAPVRAGERAERQRLVDLARTKGMQALADEWLPPMLHPAHRQDPAIMPPLVKMILRATPDEFAGEIEALLNRPNAQAELARINCPTTFVCGRQDEWSPVAQHEAMHQAVRRSTLVIIEGSGHMTPAEQPEDVSAALKSWLSN
jgi:pimeloyl-ACP methyl ester carboxylesterase